MTKYAYVRVSTKEQNIDRQLAALKPYDIPQSNLYCDFCSGKDFNRPEYQKLLKRLKPNDLLIVKSIDRLGRNCRGKRKGNPSRTSGKGKARQL